MRTDPEVFIIESLDPDDEGNGRLEGVILSNMLNFHEKKPKYCYVRTKKQFLEAVESYKESNYRYLHLSCHANDESMCTTNLEEIRFNELAKILKPCLNKKRLFISACAMVNENLAENIIPETDCYSIIGPNEPIGFSDAAIFWSSFYHLMFRHDEGAMKREELLKYVRRIHKVFEVNISYFSSSKKSSSGFKAKHFTNNDL